MVRIVEISTDIRSCSYDMTGVSGEGATFTMQRLPPSQSTA